MARVDNQLAMAPSISDILLTEKSEKWKKYMDLKYDLYLFSVTDVMKLKGKEMDA